ncbi:MAG: branched-chain amino acid transporter [Frankiales bacterium]|nr:branched-chain amino acid transporter [Frankiales bacterium]
MTRVWVTVALVALVTFAIKGFGPAAFGPSEEGSGLPAPLGRVVLLLAPLLLAALVVTNAIADGDRLHAGADTVGVSVAGLLVWRGLTVLPAVVVAAAVTALGRLAGLP